MGIKEQKVMTALQKMPENTLTKIIIIPLLESLGYLKVEFYGGTNEEGKDILCWEKDNFDEIRLIVAQVKHFKFTNRASDSKSLQTIVNQLIMCFTKTIPFTDNTNHIPYEAFLISSYPVDTKSIQSRFSSNPNLIDRKIRIIDGIKLSMLLLEKCPNIVKDLLGEDVDYNSYFKTSLNNNVVLKALGYSGSTILKNIYTDIDFALGKNSTKLFFNVEYFPKTVSVFLKNTEWVEFKQLHEISENHYTNQFINPNINDIEKKLQQLKNDLKVNNNKAWIKCHIESQKQLKDKDTDIKKLVEESELYKSQLRELNIEINSIKIDLKEKDSSQLKKSLKFKIVLVTDIQNKIDNFEVLIIKEELVLKQLDETVRDWQHKLNPTYDFKIEGTSLASMIKSNRKKIERQINEFNIVKPNSSLIKDFLQESKNIIDISGHILNNPFCKSALGIKENIVIRSNYESTRLKLSIDEIFDTGINIILLGEAGAGKTTSLQMYALNKKDTSDKLIIWANLSHVTQNWSMNSSKVKNDSKINNFELAITEYLNSKEVPISVVDFKNTLSSKKVILLLDGLDESIRSNPWLPEAIIRLSKRYSDKVQIIVTSRMSGTYLEEFPFFSVTLLPFTVKQRNSFIIKWFESKNQDIIAIIRNHLNKNKAIDEITRNPLLTTTLCVLANHGLPLPQTEIKLYNDRLRLLTGYYDNVKNIVTRISTTPQNLELISQKLAFFLHSKGRRDECFEILQENLARAVSNYISPKEAKIGLNELIDPCNILVPMTGEGNFGFGHLRYQEHLTALELISNRSINIIMLLHQEWWREALVLFAEMNDSIVWLINQIGHEIEIPKIRKTVDLMIEARPEKEQIEIKRIIAANEEDSLQFSQNL